MNKRAQKTEREKNPCSTKTAKNTNQRPSWALNVNLWENYNFVIFVGRKVTNISIIQHRLSQCQFVYELFLVSFTQAISTHCSVDSIHSFKFALYFHPLFLSTKTWSGLHCFSMHVRDILISLLQFSRKK